MHDSASFSDKLAEIMGRKISLVATVDHPYSSPPLRVLSSHYRLANLQNESPLLLIWDCITPPERGIYKSARGLDVGLLSSHDPDLCFYNADVAYPLQVPRMINFQKLRSYVEGILSVLTELPKGQHHSFGTSFLKNLDGLISIYSDVLKQPQDSSTFYKNILIRFYELLGFPDLRRFVSDAMESFYWTPISRDWIAWCLRETKDMDIGLAQIRMSGIFEKGMFRTLLNDKRFDDEDDIDAIVAGILDRSLVASSEIFFWSLALAHIKHFGNDQGFFAKLACIPGFSHAVGLQITGPNQDSDPLVEFSSARNFICRESGDGLLMQQGARTKKSRINTMPAIYCHIGGMLGQMLFDILHRQKEPAMLTMGMPYSP